MYGVDNWIIEESGWIAELIESQYISISTYRPLSGSSYVKLPTELEGSKKVLINIKSNNQKYFLCWHVRHINSTEIHPERITKKDKKRAKNLDYEIEFPVKEEGFSKVETKTTFALTCFVTDMG